jgi:hypothetical protein
MTVSLARVSHRLPVAFDALRDDAEADGHRHMGRLAAELDGTQPMFHAVFAARIPTRWTNLPPLPQGNAIDDLYPAYRSRR